MKSIAQRTCMGCNAKKDKNDFIRIIKNKNNQVEIDLTGKKEGRGIYICKDINCLKKAMKNKRMLRILEIDSLECLFQDLEQIINGGEIIG